MQLLIMFSHLLKAPTVDKNCHCLYFYGKTFDKTISIWNGNVFEKLEYLGDTNRGM